MDSILRLLGMSLTASCKVIVWLKNSLPLAQITLKEKASGNCAGLTNRKSLPRFSLATSLLFFSKNYKEATGIKITRCPC